MIIVSERKRSTRAENWYHNICRKFSRVNRLKYSGWKCLFCRPLVSFSWSCRSVQVMELAPSKIDENIFETALSLVFTLRSYRFPYLNQINFGWIKLRVNCRYCLFEIIIIFESVEFFRVTLTGQKRLILIVRFK